MNFAYVLVSDSSDIYYEQFLVSLISLKHWNPDAKVFLACDDVTKSTLVGLRSRHEKYVDEVKVVDFPKGKGKHYRSRYLKTTLREILEGDFLYVDVDTIIVEKIEENEFSYDVMAVDDVHVKPPSELQNCSNYDLKSLGFATNNPYIVNSGVLWMKDSRYAHELSKLWNQLWLETEKFGVDVDQPALNEANFRLPQKVQLLPGIYNCQISVTLKYLAHAKIIHCFATSVNRLQNDSAYLFLNKRVFLEIKEQDVSCELLKKIYDAKSAFEDPETIVLSRKQSKLFKELSKTNLYGFIYCLFNSRRGRWLFNLLDKVVCAVTTVFWRNEK